MSLEHKRPNCPGLWRQRSSGAWLHWRCEKCDAIADHSVEAAEAALRENQLGITLRQLADAGDQLRADAEEDLGW